MALISMYGPDKLIYPSHNYCIWQITYYYAIINISHTNKLNQFPTIIITLLTNVMPLRSSVNLYIVFIISQARL